MIDFELFDATYSDFGKEMIQEIINIYLGEYEKRLSDLRQNIKDLDFDSIGKNAHSLKGTIAVLYDSFTMDLARQIELKGKNRDASNLELIFNQLVEANEKLIADLLTIKEKYK